MFGSAKGLLCFQLLVISFFFGWLINGIMIYSSPENTCGDHDETKGMNTFMLVWICIFMPCMSCGLCALACLTVAMTAASASVENDTFK